MLEHEIEVRKSRTLSAVTEVYIDGTAGVTLKILRRCFPKQDRSKLRRISPININNALIGFRKTVGPTIHAEEVPSRSNRNIGRRYRALAVMLLALVVMLIGAGALLAISASFVEFVLILPPFGLLALWLSSKYFNSAAQVLFPSVSELTTADPRHPVVFLRSFHDDSLEVANSIPKF